MSLKKDLVLNLKRVVEAISKFDGVVAVLLFGSYARGDYDEYSDYDLLVIFEDKTSMWDSWKELFRAVGNFRMNIHVIPETLEELKRANPSFQEELVKFGKVLYAKLPMEVYLKPLKLRPYTIIFYDMAGLNIKDKMRISYLLYKKSGAGLLAETGGVKLNDGCILAPSNTAEKLLKALNNLGAKTRKMEVFLEADSIDEAREHKF